MVANITFTFAAMELGGDAIVELYRSIEAPNHSRNYWRFLGSSMNSFSISFDQIQ